MPEIAGFDLSFVNMRATGLKYRGKGGLALLTIFTARAKSETFVNFRLEITSLLVLELFIDRLLHFELDIIIASQRVISKHSYSI